ncbi:hypothetical protein HDV02_003245 [Globomyces sp. JEL0801]|nr:hypothetical protein HDV02_003245 [Globomyces sp. JEL0801]
MSNRPYDIIVWGATGFTGALVAEYLTRNAPANVKFALAGRNLKKLNPIAQRLKRIDQVYRFAKEDVPIIIADVDACVRLKTHYVDITGETNFIRNCIDKYHDQAVANGVLIVNSVGFDSLPSDLGTFLIANYFKSKSYKTDNVRYTLSKVHGGLSGGTLHTICNMMESTPIRELYKLTTNPEYLAPKVIPNKKSWNGTLVYYDKGLQTWQTPFLMESGNLRYVRRSNYLLNYGPNFQYCEGIAASNIIFAFYITISMAFFGLIMLLPPVRWILKRYLPPGTGPSPETQKSGHFTVDLYGEATDLLGRKHFASAVVIGNEDPGYSGTAKMIAESALCLALDLKACQQPGRAGSFPMQKAGVVTAASSMGLVLVERLRCAGMTLDIYPINTN